VALVAPPPPSPEHQFESGSVFDLDLQSPDQQTACTLPMKVVRSMEQPDGSWLLGCAFLRALTSAEFQSMLKAAPQSNPPASKPIPISSSSD